MSRAGRAMGAPTGGPAFFDFDNTLIHGDAGRLFGRHLYEHSRRGTGRLRMWARYAPFAALMLMQAGRYRVGAVRREALRRGWRVMEMAPPERGRAGES